MPELVTSAVASIERQGDIAFRNIIGSNIYNTLGIGGATALMAPGPVPMQIVRFDNLVMLGVSIALVVFAWTGLRINRWEGVALLPDTASMSISFGPGDGVGDLLAKAPRAHRGDLGKRLLLAGMADTVGLEHRDADIDHGAKLFR